MHYLLLAERDNCFVRLQVFEQGGRLPRPAVGWPKVAESFDHPELKSLGPDYGSCHRQHCHHHLRHLKQQITKFTKTKKKLDLHSNFYSRLSKGWEWNLSILLADWFARKNVDDTIIFIHYLFTVPFQVRSYILYNQRCEIQWGLENWTRKTESHSNSEHFYVQI